MKVVLIAHPRSGSNSLVEVLEAHPRIDAIENEPFAEGYAEWDPRHTNYYDRVRAGEDFDTLVSEVFSSSDGLKELSYQLDGEQLGRLVHRDDVRVVTLRRTNLLMTALSQVLAELTDLWKTWDATKPLVEYYADLPALDIGLIRERMAWTATEVARVAEAVRDIETLDLVYEDLFTGDVEARVEAVAPLGDFLGVGAFDSYGIRHYLSPAVQQGGAATYGQVRNLDAIEAALGSDATGHVSGLGAL